MPQSRNNGTTNQMIPLKMTSQFVLDYMTELMLKTAPLNYPGNLL
jgi:hypothetical protein